MNLGFDLVLAAVFLCVVESLPRFRGLRSVRCGGNMRSASGEISSPNFPRNYPNEVECQWKIIGVTGSRITLTFRDFKVEKGTDCEYDSLEVYNGERKDASKRIAKLCGSTLPQVIVSRDSSLFLYFHSDFSVSFKGFRLHFSQSGIFDPCRDNNGGCFHVCTSRGQTRHCSCHTGYVLAFDEEKCTDIDECQVNNGGCSSQCVNTPGSFHCICTKGYSLSKDDKTCVNINECTTNQHKCGQNCRDSEGSYFCECRRGYQLNIDGYSCIDQDECMIGSVQCDQRCINTEGNYFCSCFQGFRPSTVMPSKCVDVDECQEGLPDYCHTCINSEGSYHCLCDKGYVQANNRTRCEDINECASHDGKGDCNHMCNNTAGSYNCSCHGGYSLTEDGRTCQDIDECVVNNGGCKQKCVNFPGNFTCACQEGYLTVGKNGSDFICKDIDECSTGLHECDSGATCVNIEGNYTCLCPAGYYADFHDCVDIDECSQGICERECTNTQGSYLCMCPDGYELAEDKRHCRDTPYSTDIAQTSKLLELFFSLSKWGRFHGFWFLI